MDKNQKIRDLQELYDSLLPKAKSWNRDRILLVWGFSAALFMTTALELFRILTREYDLKIKDFLWAMFHANVPNNVYVLGTFLLCIIFFIIVQTTGKIIDQNAEDANKTLEVIKKELERLKSSS